MTIAAFLFLACAGSPGVESTVELAAEGSPSEPAATGPDAATDGNTDPPPGVKAPGNLPVRTESELAAEAAAREACVSSCEQRRAMEAVAPEVITSGCQAECRAAHPITQVEVVPDFPGAPVDPADASPAPKSE